MGGLRIIDVSNPLFPTELGSFELEPFVTAGLVSGDIEETFSNERIVSAKIWRRCEHRESPQTRPA